MKRWMRLIWSRSRRAGQKINKPATSGDDGDDEGADVVADATRTVVQLRHQIVPFRPTSRKLSQRMRRRTRTWISNQTLSRHLIRVSRIGPNARRKSETRDSSDDAGGDAGDVAVRAERGRRPDRQRGLKRGLGVLVMNPPLLENEMSTNHI